MIQRRRRWHLLVVPIPIAAVLGTLASDLAFLLSGHPLWAQCSLALARMAVLTGLAAAAAGLRDLLKRPELRRSGYAVVHFFASLPRPAC